MTRPTAVLACAAASAVLLAGCGSDDPALRQAAEAPSATPSQSADPSSTPPPTPTLTTSASPTAVSSPTPTSSPSVKPVPTTSPRPTVAPTTPASSALQLNGGDLGVTRLGEPYEQALDAITTVLGKGTAVSDRVYCIGSDRTTQWGAFRAVSKGGMLSGWTISSNRLEAPSGVKVGTDVATLERVYGDRFQRFGPNPDNGPTFSVQGVDFLGGLSSTESDATVTSLYTASCSGP